MSYSEQLDQQLRRLTEDWSGLVAKKMFGGVGYLLRGNMCFGVHKDFLILRLGKEEALAFLDSGKARPFDITGRPMKGWVMIHESAIPAEEELSQWLAKAKRFCDTLPPK